MDRTGASEDEGGEEKLDIGRVFPEKSDSTTMRQLLRKKKESRSHQLLDLLFYGCNSFGINCNFLIEFKSIVPAAYFKYFTAAEY